MMSETELVLQALSAYSAGDLIEAERQCRLALQNSPNQPAACHLLGVIALQAGRLDEAVDYISKAISIAPGEVEFYNNLGLALTQRRQFAEAVAVYEQAIAINPTMPELYFNLGIARQASKDIERAGMAFGQAVALSPAALDYLSAWVHVRQQLCDWDDIEVAAGRLVRAVDQCDREPLSGDIAPFSFLALPIPTTHEQQLRCARHWAARIAVGCKTSQPTEQNTNVDPISHSPTSPSPRLGERGPGGEGLSTRNRSSFEQRDSIGNHQARSEDHPAACAARLQDKTRLRIGYLSGDFRDHPVGWLIAELLESHDRSRFDVFGYSIGRPDTSDIGKRLVTAFDTLRDLHQTSWSDAADCIRRDEIDILIDLQGHTQDARPEILAARPAPIQVGYLGYPGTSGTDFIDYLIVDRFVVPPDQQSHYSEKLFYLPHCFMVQDSRTPSVVEFPSRASLNLPESSVVLCAFSSYYKLTPAMFDAWLRILRAVPDSVLWLRDGPPAAMDRLVHRAAAAGIDPTRIVFAPLVTRAEHLARQAIADLFLDTFPYNQHSTAADALRVGLPVVTLAGETFASRVAGSLLTELGLTDLITETPEAYETLIVTIARDTALRAGLRKQLAESLLQSRMYDGNQFAKSLETSFVEMFTAWDGGRLPRPSFHS